MASDSFYEAYVSVIPSAKGFEKSLSRQIDGPATGAGAQAGKSSGLGFVGGFGKAIPLIGGVLAAAGIGNIIGDSISNASNYAQAQGAVEDVFGRLGADAIGAFAESGAENVGQSMNEILKGATNFGIFGKAAGLADTELVDFSTNLITLGADLAAFANTTPEQAVEALAAGLRGESEPLRQYGILLDDATLRMKALELGIYDGTGSLTQQQRILAANAVIFEQSAIQQGKFAAESDSLAGKQAILAAAFENISIKLGTALIPIAEKFVNFMISDMIPALEKFTAWLEKPETQNGITQFGNALIVVTDIARGVGVAFTDTLGLINGVVRYLNGTLSFSGFIQKMRQLPGFWGMVFRAAADAGRGIGQVVGTIIGTVSRFARETKNNVGVAVNEFFSLPGRIASSVGNLGGLLFGAGQNVIRGLVNGITSMFGSVVSAIRSTVDGAIGWAKNLLGIHSPSTVFAEIGANTAKGFAIGVEGEYRVVRSATAGMTGAAVSAVDGSARGGETINITGLITQTSAAEIAYEIEKRKRRRVASALAVV